MRERSFQHLRVKMALIGFTLVLLLGSLLPATFSSAQQPDLVGDYSVFFLRQQIPTDLANGSMIAGRWRLSFLEDGAYQAERLDLGVLISGTYEVTGETVAITDLNGLLSCSNPSASIGGTTDVATAEYGFLVDSGNLKLTPITEGCPLRRALLSTSDFSTYVACATVPENPSDVVERLATPVLNEAITDLLRSDATPSAGVRDPGTSFSSTDGQIDQLLAQMSACWTTGDPARFLPLLSTEFSRSFVGNTDEETAATLSSLQAAMQVPIVWERAGDVTENGNDRAEAVVRTTAGGQEEFVRYLFVNEDNSWKWDGSTT